MGIHVLYVLSIVSDCSGLIFLILTLHFPNMTSKKSHLDQLKFVHADWCIIGTGIFAIHGVLTLHCDFFLLTSLLSQAMFREELLKTVKLFPLRPHVYINN